MIADRHLPAVGLSAQMKLQDWWQTHGPCKKVSHDIIDVIFLCNPSYFFPQCKALEASNLTNSPKPAPKLFFLWVQLITAVQQHRLGGGLTGKVYWLFGFRTSQEFSNYRQNPYESLCEVRNAFVARSCRKY